MIITPETLKKISKECEAQLLQMQLPIQQNTPISFNNRSYRAYGRTRRAKSVITGRWIYKIEISHILADITEVTGLKSVIYHEYIHTIDGCFNHGALFKYYAHLIAETTGIEVYTYVTDAQTKQVNQRTSAKYEVSCKKCGYTAYMYRKRKWFNYACLISHKNCGGEFKIIQLR